MSNTAFIEDDPSLGEAGRETILGGACARGHAPDGRGARAALAEGSTTQPTAESFTADGVRAVLSDALAGCPAEGVEVVSATPEWVELRIPCDLAAVPPLQKLLTQLDADLPPEVREAISYAFREMLTNAVEYGGRFDPSERVEVRFVRLKRAVICRIKDPGEGFDPARLEHAAISNPDDDPIRHASVREEKGLRAGGFGILLTAELVDELVYNERHNELMFVKYLS
jgi:anti-sigma regulatory factor (Ser/Thr protein kinase)